MSFMVAVNALVAHQDAEGSIALAHEVVDESFLPDGDVHIAVEYSGVNYKDALAVTPKGGVARSYPLIPRVDVAGTVTPSTAADFADERIGPRHTDRKSTRLNSSHANIS